ncbi:DEAD/DEAH box helicase [Aspergillus thermomutatus]|uniref:DNA2/NAM7 helicase-like C-terminal domain-containing protein n=1 Tax=Aspergillus thermomutatus TaxID=41047 RepID=A0A397GH75_ASPTH|nr:uncharacterized protein CDV56_103065 [Aspergillus thermomutatus]RHZ50301.1 hypothetical protein CDV56_103065 [Aspergillus thermomutatus]
MDRLEANDDTDIPMWDETIVPGSSAGSVSYPAIIARDTEDGPQFLCSWQGEEPGVKLRLAPLVQAGCHSYLELRFAIRFRVPSQEDSVLTTGHVFLTAFHVASIRAQPVVAQGQENAPAGAIVAHPSLYAQHNHLQEAINDNSIWGITVSKHPDVHLHAANLFCHRSFGDQDALIAQIREHLGNQQLRFFVRGYEVNRILLQLNTRLSEDANNNPLRAWYPGHPSKVFLQIGDYPNQENRPVVTRSTKPSFLNWEEYVTLLGFGLIYEHEHEHVARQMQSLADSIATLKVIEIPGADSRRYIGFLELPDEFCLDLQPGDAMKVNFNVEEPESHTDWHACVVDSLPIAPPKAVTILLTRPWDKENREWVRFDDDLEPSVILIEALGFMQNARSRLLARDSQQVAVNVLFSEKPFHRQITALRELQNKRTEKVSTWLTLLGNNFMHLQAVDAYQTIADDFSALVHQFQFNQAQQDAFARLRTLPVFLLFLASNNRHTGRRYQVMLLAPPNDVVNDLAIVVRCHALSTEEDLLLMPAKKQRPPPANARPPIIADDHSTHDDSLLAQVALAQMLFDFHQAQTAQPLGVSDRRVKHVELSIGYRMLQLCGIIKTSWSTPDAFISFREHYRLYQAGEEFDDTTWMDFRARSRELRDTVLARADVILCTLHTAGETAIRDNVQPQAILVDEAARASEPELWPALAFFNPNAFVLIGDHHQLRPLVLSSHKQNPLADQLQMSLFSRLHRDGLHAVMLKEQHRMHESMAQMVSSIFYNGELQTSRATADQTRELARQINLFNRRTFRHSAQMLFLDVKDSMDHRDAQQRSRLNAAHRSVAAALVIRLLSQQVAGPTGITVLTPYRAQLKEYQALFAILQQQQPGLQLHLVQLKTIDSFQGRESNVVILDLTIVSSLGFMREGNRLNVALSRAKHALYIIGNYKAMDRPGEKQKPSPFVRRLLKYISQHRHRVPVPDNLTTTLPDAAVEEQNGAQVSGTWGENAMDVDGTAQSGASGNW